jgi:hypothetical protein
MEEEEGGRRMKEESCDAHRTSWTFAVLPVYMELCSDTIVTDNEAKEEGML